MKGLCISLFFLFILGKEPFPTITETVFTSPSEWTEPMESIVFIAGSDAGKNAYYTHAKMYFEGLGIPVVCHLFSLEEIIQWLNQDINRTKIFDEIHIVSHGNPWLGMSLKTTVEGQRISLKTLSLPLVKRQMPRIMHGISDRTKIIFHSCGLGENRPLLYILKQILTSNVAPKVFASPFFTVFGGKYAPHYLARPFYGYYPTAESPGPRALSKEFKETYPHAGIDWATALRTRKEGDFGETYTYTFNIPVDWTFTFGKKSEVPRFSTKGDLMDWLAENETTAKTLFQLGIPIEKYRWKSKVKASTLYIYGKTTVLCVLQPVMETQDGPEYRAPCLDDGDLYQIL